MWRQHGSSFIHCSLFRDSYPKSLAKSGSLSTLWNPNMNIWIIRGHLKHTQNGDEHNGLPVVVLRISKSINWCHMSVLLRRMVKSQWFLGRNINVCVNPTSQINSFRITNRFDAQKKNTHTLGHTTHLQSQRPSVRLVVLGLHMVPVEVMAQWKTRDLIHLRKGGVLVGWLFSDTFIKTSQHKILFILVTNMIVQKLEILEIFNQEVPYT